MRMLYLLLFVKLSFPLTDHSPLTLDNCDKLISTHHRRMGRTEARARRSTPEYSLGRLARAAVIVHHLPRPIDLFHGRRKFGYVVVRSCPAAR